jgi:hypothetical protein
MEEEALAQGQGREAAGLKLRYKEHIARAALKGLKAAMELKRLRGLSPLTA